MEYIVMKNIKMLAVISVTAMLAFSTGRPQKGEWKGKILTEDGIKVVANPAEPVYGRINLDLQEELRIGREGDEQAQFYRVRDIGVDAQGNIHVVDMSNSRVQVFDPAGKYMRTIGRGGQGPGEFEMPTQVRFGGLEGYTHVLDRFRRISLFDGRGAFVRSVPIDHPLRTFDPAAGSGWFAILQTGSDEKLTSFHTLSRLNDQGKTEKVLAEFPDTMHMERTAGGVMSVRTGFELSLYAAPLGEDSLVYGYSGGYELVVLGAGGGKSLIIRKDEPRPEFTSEEKKEFGRVPVPDRKPYFFGLLTDSNGRIYVERNMTMKVKRGYGPMATEDKIVDVFSREGRCLFRTALPPSTRVIRGDLVYAYFVDEDQGLEFVQRFRIRNIADLPKK